MYEISLKARAKINISLDVLRKREDGYHEVRMIMQTVELYDKIYMRKMYKKGIVLNVNLKWIPSNENNLAYKAARLLMDKFHIDKGVYIDLYKRIPVAAGLAGGSSDAAAVLVGMNKLFHLGLSKNQLMVLAKDLGADVPYCIMQGTALAEGIGEKLTKLPEFPECHLVLAKPNINVSTPWVYNHLNVQQISRHPKTDQMIKAIENKDLFNVTSELCNVLEEVTIKQYPIIQDIKDKLIDKGAIGSLMSGSGPTVFGIFDDEQKAKKAAYDMKIEGIGKQVFYTKIFNPQRLKKA